MTTTTTTLPMPAHHDKYGFPLMPCTRCGGSGSYSYNAMHGSRCYGCSGTGWNIAVGAAAGQAAFRAEQKRGWECLPANVNGYDTYGTMAPGDEINTRKGDPWMTVASVEIGEREMGWSLRNGVQVPTAWECTITFTDGTTRQATTSSIFRRRRLTDPAPFVEHALSYWRRKGCRGGIK